MAFTIFICTLYLHLQIQKLYLLNLPLPVIIILDLNQLIFLCILVKPTLRNILSVTKVLCIGMHCHFSLKNALHLSLSNGY